MIDPRAEAYAEQATTPPPEHLRELAERTRAELDAPQMFSGAVEGRLLETLVWATGARLVVDVGTYSGNSALSMAAALADGGRVVTLEADAGRAAFARAAIAASPHAGVVELREGPALASIEAIDGPVDLAFLDADKEGYVACYEALVPKLAPRGLIVADNTLRGGRAIEDPDDPIARFNAHVAADRRTVQVLLTVRDGVTLVRRA